MADDPIEERRDGVSGHARAVPGLPSAAVLREQLTELVAADVFQRADAAGETVCAGSVRRRPEELRAHPPGCRCGACGAARGARRRRRPRRLGLAAAVRGHQGAAPRPAASVTLHAHLLAGPRSGPESRRRVGDYDRAVRCDR